MKERSVLVAVASALLLLLAGCRKEPTDAQWDVDLAVPLIHSTLTIRDLVPDSLLTTADDGGLILVSNTRLFTLSLDTVLTPPDTSFRYAYALPFPGPVEFAAGTTFNASNDVTEFDLDDLRLRELRIRSGQVDLSITSRMNGTILGTFGLPGAALDGVPFQLLQTIPPGTVAAPTVVSGSSALDGYVFDLRGPTLNAVNTLATSLSYRSDPQGGPITVSGSDSLIAVVSYHDIVPEYATGYFGTRLVTVEPASTAFDLFEGISGHIDLQAVTARLEVRNGVGAEIRARIHQLRAVNTTANTSVDLLHAITQGPLNLDRALDLQGGFQPALNTYVLTETNSNVADLLGILPDRIDHSLDITLDPLGDVSNGHDFVYHDSRVTADLLLEVPLHLSANGLTLVRTTTVDLPGSSEGHALQDGVLHLFGTNGFPFSVGLRLAIVDEADGVLALLGPGGTLPAATVDTDGTVLAPVAGQVDFAITAEQLHLLYTGGRVRITATFDTPADTFVRIRADHRLDIRISAEGGYLINGDE